MTGAEILIAGSVLQGISGFAGGMAQAKAAKQNANAAVTQAAEEQRRFRVQTLRQRGAENVAAASQGAGIDSLDLLSDNAANQELDALMIKYGGQVRANDFKAQASAAKSAAYGSLFSAAVSAGSGLSQGGFAGSELFSKGGSAGTNIGGFAKSSSSLTSYKPLTFNY